MKDVALKHRGGAAELLACVWLMRQGLEVFRHVSSCGFVDIMVYDPMTKRSHLVEVKTRGYTEYKGKAYGYYGALSEAQREHGTLLLVVDNKSSESFFIGDDKQPMSTSCALGRKTVVRLDPSELERVA